MPNRLAAESSPYLQQHAGNPVDWFPWGAPAFAAARRGDKPVLLSIGYAACHWCHVMAHESFEDATTAKLMNDLFVNVKVDREERPDVDSIYMQAVQAISGHGGWPMTVFLTPEGVPFFGGTYYPPEDRHGMPSFRRVLVSVSEAWRTRREEVLKGATTLRGIYEAAEAPTQAGKPLIARHVAEAIADLRDRFDTREGGFGGAPKFPQPQLLDLLLHHWARTGEEEWIRLARHTWARMAAGGLHDQLGGGFHRYTVDGRWMVPHFEKMLYDNALLARLGVRLWQADHDPEVRRVVEGTFGWVRREMTDPAGGWYSSLDADSEGEEGRFYVWTRDELRALLGGDSAVAEAHWGVSADGNFEGRNILHVARTIPEAAASCGIGEADAAAAIARARARLLAARDRRARPARDDKVITAWNGLMLRAMAEGARAFDDAALAEAALRAGTFLAREMRHEGRLMRTWRDGRATIPAFLEDHAALGLGFIALHQLTFDRAWLDRALALDAACVRWFWDENAGAFFDTAHDAEPLVTRPRDVADNAMPSGTSLAAELQLLAAEYTGDDRARRRVEYVLATLATPMRRTPLAFGHLLGVADRAVNGTLQLAIAGDPASAPFRALARVAAGACVPQLVIAGGQGAAVAGLPLMEGRAAPPGGALAYVCRGYACERPTTTPAELAAQLGRPASGG